MRDIIIFSAFVKTTLNEIAKQAYLLGTGLQNAAPEKQLGVPNKSVLYLLNIFKTITQIATECGQLKANSPDESNHQDDTHPSPRNK